MKTNRFVYEGKVRNILVVEENNEDVYGYDLDSWSEEMKKKLETSFRHFKKNKIKTCDNVQKEEVEKPKKFEI